MKRSECDKNSMQEKPVICPLCGYKIEDYHKACSGCPLAGDCNMIICPHCLYEFVDVKNYKDKWKKRFGRKKK